MVGVGGGEGDRFGDVLDFIGKKQQHRLAWCQHLTSSGFCPPSAVLNLKRL